MSADAETMRSLGHRLFEIDEHPLVQLSENQACEQCGERRAPDVGANGSIEIAEKKVSPADAGPHGRIGGDRAAVRGQRGTEQARVAADRHEACHDAGIRRPPRCALQQALHGVRSLAELRVDVRCQIDRDGRIGIEVERAGEGRLRERQEPGARLAAPFGEDPARPPQLRPGWRVARIELNGLLVERASVLPVRGVRHQLVRAHVELVGLGAGGRLLVERAAIARRERQAERRDDPSRERILELKQVRERGLCASSRPTTRRSVSEPDVDRGVRTITESSDARDDETASGTEKARKSVSASALRTRSGSAANRVTREAVGNAPLRGNSVGRVIGGAAASRRLAASASTRGRR